MDPSKKDSYDQIMNQIPVVIKEFLKGNPTPIRILGDVPNYVLDSSNYLKSIRPIVSKVQQSVCENRPYAQTCFVAVNIHPGRHSYFVLDIDNFEYNYETAHNDTSQIPVYVFRLSVGKRIRLYYKDGRLDATIARTLATMHNGHGDDPLPLVDDYHQVVEYYKPRSLWS